MSVAIDMHDFGRENSIIRVIVGREALELHKVQAVNLQRTSAAISRGGATKRYGSSTANEDGALLGEGCSRSLIAVADAHEGPMACEMALDWLAIHKAPIWVTKGVQADQWSNEAFDLFDRVNDYIYCQRIQAVGSRTTLALALIDPIQSLILAASAGDSHVFLLSSHSASSVSVGSGAGSFFLGKEQLTEADVASNCGISINPSAGIEAVLVASDGISTKGVGFADPLVAIREIASKSRPIDLTLEWERALATDLVAKVCQTQEENQSGDDIAVAVARADSKQ